MEFIGKLISVASDFGTYIISTYLGSLGMMICPCVGYVMQTYTMIQTNQHAGFSTFVSFILIISNLLRLFWWYCEHFSVVILIASIIMITCQLILLYYWVKLKNLAESGVEGDQSDLRPNTSYHQVKSRLDRQLEWEVNSPSDASPTLIAEDMIKI